MTTFVLNSKNYEIHDNDGFRVLGITDEDGNEVSSDLDIYQAAERALIDDACLAADIMNDQMKYIFKEDG